MFEPQFLEEPLVLTIVCTLLGLTVGSFLNVVIHRLPKMLERGWKTETIAMTAEYLPAPLRESVETWWQEQQLAIGAASRYNLATPRSSCPHCGHVITALENIPVLSYVVLRGRCGGCKTHISARYPLVELLTGVLSAGVAWHFGYGWACLGALVFVWSIVALCFIDLDTMLLPDDITLPLLWLGLLFNIGNVFTSPPSAVAGAAVGYLVLWLVYWLFKLVTGKEGMGYGDFKLLAAIGAWLGWQVLPIVILLSSLVGAIVGIALMVFAKHGRETPIPFGPYLGAAGVLALFFGKPLSTVLMGI
ncbi:MAG TPA: A24 family peptidase [Rhodocyclaceae bacterium]|nr:A24 family peptidase [Rhodocyclaceae bacterium]